MTSTIKVNNVQNQCGTNIIKRCGTTTTVGSGASNPIVVCGSSVTIGRCGGTVALASGATQSGFGRSGSVDWQTTPKTSTFTAASGEGYFINQSSAITMNLPSGTAGAIVAVADYARNFATYNLTVARNGSQKIGGVDGNLVLNVNGQAATLVYVDDTKGWVNVQNAEDTETGTEPFIQATGGSTSTSGNFKIHTFTGPGTFCVSAIAPGPSGNPNNVDYLVVAGGGGGGSGGGPPPGGSGAAGGGGGAGGYRESPGSATGCYSVSPLGAAPAAAIAVTVQGYPIAVGGGGGGVVPGVKGDPGNNSSALGITSAAGGGGGSRSAPDENGEPGGSGGGRGGPCGSVGTGNTPPVNPPQGNPGGSSSGPNFGGGGGGGATVAGSATSPGSGGTIGGPGGTGATSSINGTPTARAGGGGGGGGGDVPSGHDNAGGNGGSGGGGNGGPNGSLGTAGGVNTGGGGGGGGANPGKNGKGGGSGIVILRYKFQ
mgnify:CR=1 FL=1